MAFRVIDVKVVKVEAEFNRFVIRREKIRLGKRKIFKTLFRADPDAVITKRNRPLLLSNIKRGDRVIIDFIKTNGKELLAKGINVLT